MKLHPVATGIFDLVHRGIGRFEDVSLVLIGTGENPHPDAGAAAVCHAGVGLLVLQSIKDWLLQHITTEDKPLGKFLNGKL